MTSNNYVTVRKNGIPLINSVKLAEAFHKRPKTINNAIEKLLSFNGVFESKYLNKKNVELKCYEITLQGFGRLATIFKKKDDHLLIQEIFTSFREYRKDDPITFWEQRQELIIKLNIFKEIIKKSKQK
ncbi:MAG: hypothetical protein Q8Q51_11575 [Lutibacter sp.]|nr:hypothetical protein [Lutibacter sp.]